jgi:DNA-directed RNA polymerase subunit M/transcription elongation factor TFIIS
MTARVKLPDPEHCRACGARGNVFMSMKLDGYRRQRRQCVKCGHRWSTFVSVLSPARVRLRIPPKAML